MKKILTSALLLGALNANAAKINLDQPVDVKGELKTYNQLLKQSIQCTSLFNDFEDPKNPGYDRIGLITLYSEYAKYLADNAKQTIDMVDIVEKSINEFNKELGEQKEDKKTKFITANMTYCYILAGYIIEEIEKKQDMKFSYQTKETRAAAIAAAAKQRQQ